MKYIVGAYATAPSTLAWKPELEEKYYNQIKLLEDVQWIEHPFVGALHPYDDLWFLNNISKEWSFVFTSIPGVMKALSSNAEFGIASDDENGQKLALQFYWQAREAIVKLNKNLGRKAVKFMKIHTAPNRQNAVSSSVESLKKSLRTMSGWDWDGAKLIIEHCDAFIENSVPEKGFLTIEEEISAILSINNTYHTSIGMSINWGRSAIETKSVTGPIHHITKAYEANLLKGIIFSGASDSDTPYGIWKDTHMPHAKAYNVKCYAKKSCLTSEEIERSLAICDVNELAFIGGKISIISNNSTIEQRVLYNRDLLTVIKNSVNKVNKPVSNVHDD